MPAAKPPIRAPVLPKRLEPATLTHLDDLELEGRLVSACALSKVRGAQVRFDGVHVVGGTLGESHVAHLNWLDVLCERCDLSMIVWRGAKLTRVEVRDCRGTGAKVAEGEFDSVRFVECALDYASFGGTRFRQSSFERCRLREADFTGADLSGTTFVDCDLEGADLTGAKLQGADVSTSTLNEIRVTAEDVRGMVVSREQAAMVARLFGVVVRE